MYRSYEYSDFGGVEFESYIIPERDLRDNEFRTLEVDSNVVLPVYTQIRVLVTAADVLYSRTVPTLGVKIDATPGPINTSRWIISGYCEKKSSASSKGLY